MNERFALVCKECYSVEWVKREGLVCYTHIYLKLSCCSYRKPLIRFDK